MKKVLLSSVAIFASLASVYAQCVAVGTGECAIATKPDAMLAPGYKPANGYAKDYFGQNIPYDSLYWWSQVKEGPKTVQVDSANAGGDCVPNITDVFSYTFTRSIGKQSYTLVQPYGSYEPIGVGFGKVPVSPGSLDSIPKTLDISGGRAYVSFRFTNTSTANVWLGIALQDAKDSLLNAVGPETEPLSMYKDEVKLKVAAGATLDTTINFNANAYSIIYKYKECHVGEAIAGDTKFDYTKLAGVAFTVTNQLRVDADGYKPIRLRASFEFSKFFVGDLQGMPVGLLDNYIAKPSFKISPNPVNSGSVKFEKAENVTVTDLMGKLVYSAPSASEINVEGFNKGVYIITSSKGAARFVVE